jgi:F0F1-type ATP synthase assembly protein I
MSEDEQNKQVDAEPELPDPSVVTDRAKETANQAFEDLDAQLQSIQSSAARGRASLDKAQPGPDSPSRTGMTDPETARGLGVGLTIAYAILGMPLVMFGLGWLIDQAFKTTLWQSLLGLIGFFMGCGYAVYAAQANAKRMR